MVRRATGHAGLPRTRVGICCGDACRAAEQRRGHWVTDALWQHPSIPERYRCADCYEAETGSRPWDAPPRQVRP